MSTQYIGSKITVVSNMGVRYEGILNAIDTVASTVELTNVVSFGTEGRGTTQIQGSNTVYPNVVFRGSDIKDLKVTSQQPVASQQPTPVLQDPAIVSQSSVPQQAPNIPTTNNVTNMPPNPPSSQQQQRSKLIPNVSLGNNNNNNNNNNNGQQQRTTTNAWGNNNNNNKHMGNNNNNNNKNRQRSRNNNNRNNRSGNKSYAAVGTGASLMNRRERGHQSRNDEEIKKEFDFQKQLEGFNKEDFIQEKLKLLSMGINANNNISNDNNEYGTNDDNNNNNNDGTNETSQENEGHLTAADILSQNSGPKYDKKSSFFDDLSSDATDRLNNNNTYDRNAQRQKNLDTFGAESLHNNQRRRYRGGYRGRGRGRRRGGYRGRGRGGYRGRRNNRGRGGYRNNNNRQRNYNHNNQPRNNNYNNSNNNNNNTNNNDS